MILDDIVAWVKTEVAAAKTTTSLSQLETQAQKVAPARGFRDALRRPKESGATARVIAEVKKASPSKGVIRPDFDPPQIARQYRDGGATALSVLTNSKFFHGSLEYLEAVRRTVDLPLLRKEFIVDPFQIVEARAAGADAILLIVSILSDDELLAFRQLAESMGMDCLVEVHTREEGERAARSGASLIGVNNRDLKTFVTDVRHTEKILPALPKNAVLVSESGIRTKEEVDYLVSLGIDAILVGETFMRMEDPGQGIKELVGDRGR